MAGLLASVVTAAPPDLSAQQPATPAPTAEALLEPVRVSPGGAFLRAVLVPGWGHASIGSYTRGGFYFALESATAYTLIRTRQRLSEARQRASLYESAIRTDLANEGITDPQAIQDRLDEDPTLSSFNDLIASRESQQEDLVAFGIFLLFLTGADAYVSAHLSRFPTPIDVQVSPSVVSGRAEVALRIILPNFP